MSVRHRLLVSSCPLVILGILAGLLLAPAPAAAWNDLTFYFDTSYTQNTLWTHSVPQLVTAYLVLTEPTDWVAGWEGQLRLDGPIEFLSAEIHGDAALNILQPPSFMVGIGGAPLAMDYYDGIRLATFQFLLTGTEPASISLEEIFYHSLDEPIPCFLDTQGELVPMFSTPAYTNFCEPECNLPWDHLYYTPLAQQEEETRWITILNYNFETCGSPDLDIRLGDYTLGSSDNFALTGISGVYEQSFRTLQIPVAFRPTGPGFHQAIVRLGGSCDVVWLSGVCREPAAGADQVGVFFDSHATEFARTAAAGETIHAYVGLLNPSSTAGVGAWEGCIEVRGDAVVTPSYLGSSAVNELTAPCYRVTLPNGIPTADDWDRFTILTGLDITVGSTAEPIEIVLTPAADATIPGQLSWTPVGATEPIAMPTYLDQPICAWINSTPVAVEAPRPLAHSSGETVTLSWQVSGANEGCNVYRRTEQGQPARLNSEPLRTAGAVFTYVDDPVGFAPGQTLYYSYALLSGGQEIAVSPEVEVRLDMPAVTETRLLAPTPNPFNPRTELRFELKSAGPARLTIHDLTGKVVRTILDQEMPAGPGSRDWFGDDDQGRRLPSGVYMMRLVTPDRITQGKLVLLK